MDNYTGKRLDGRYEIQEVVGVGGMAVVYKAYDNIDDRTVAVKILKEEYLANEEFRRRFKNESKAIAVLSHPNIVKVFNVSYGDRLQYIVMEYVEGITLKEYIEQQGKLGIKETVHFTMQILRALQHAHDKGIVHRDIKPQNIMLLSNGNIKVTDFGIARFSYSDTKTMTDSAIGSVHYISPEQARGDATDDRADIYSVGVVMYEMLTGQLPFQSDNSVSVALMQLQNDPKNPRELNPNIPVGLEQIVMHAMRKNAKERYQSAAEMLLDIEEFKRNPTIRFQKNYFVDNDPTKYIKKTVAPKPPVPPVIQTVQPAVPDPNFGLDDDDDDDDETTSSGIKGRVLAIVFGALGGLLVAAGISVLLLFAFNRTYILKEIPVINLFFNDDKVADLVDKAYSQVKDSKMYENYVFTVEEVADSSRENGVISKQDPAAGEEAEKDDDGKIHVTIWVVNNNRKVLIPESVVGKDSSTAEQQLKRLGFKVEKIPTLSFEDYGTVVKTSPEAGTEADEGCTVTIYYASNDDFITVPKVTDWDYDTAKQMLENSGLTVSTEVIEVNSDKPAGTVVAQNPAEGESVAPKTPVILSVSNGIPASATASLSVTMPANNRGGSVDIYVNGVLYSSSTILLDGTAHTFEVNSTGANVPIKIFVEGREYYTCTVDFTQDPAVISNPSYSSLTGLATAKIPNVIGLTEDGARASLGAAGFSNIEVEPVIVYDETQVGVVIDQNPKADTGGIMGYYLVTEKITIKVGVLEGV